MHECIYGVEYWSLHMCKQPQAHKGYEGLQGGLLFKHLLLFTPKERWEMDRSTQQARTNQGLPGEIPSSGIFKIFVLVSMVKNYAYEHHMIL